MSTRRDVLQLQRLSGFEGERPAWSSLAERAGNLFATWEWQSLWWKHFGAGRPLMLWGWSGKSGALEGILPLYIATHRPLRTLRFLGQGIGQRLGPVCSADERDRAAEALRAALRETPRWDLFIGEALPAEEGWVELLGGPRLRSAVTPVLRGPWPDWKAFLARQTKHFRHHLKNEENRLGRGFRLGFRLANDPEQLDADLDILFRLHAARWADEADHPFLAQEDFHREFAAAALEQGWLRLWFLELDGRPAAALYACRFGDAEWLIQAGRDPTLKRYSAGFVLVAHVLREAVGDGVTECRLLRGGQQYKLRFATDEAAVETVALARGFVGRVALVAARTLPRQTRNALAKRI
jgi:CelD/BcsL family acetyltransferase involved in cellulose biosynthesis